MRDVLLDLVKQTGNLTAALRVLGTDTETVIKGCDETKTLFLEATLKTPLPEFEGDFGITNLSLLSGLLNFPNYRSDDATFSVKTRERDGTKAVEQFEFRNKVTGNEADFRMMDPKHIPDQANIGNIPWDVQFEPVQSKVTEFAQLAGLYTEVDKNFGVKVKDGNLIFYIGEEDAANHRASMVFATDVKGELKGSLTWQTFQFLSIMKLIGQNPTTIKITSRGVLGITVTTPYGTYNYFIRANR
jgi:hypothetical protein